MTHRWACRDNNRDENAHRSDWPARVIETGFTYAGTGGFRGSTEVWQGHSPFSDNIGLDLSITSSIRPAHTWVGSLTHKRGLLTQKCRELSRYADLLNRPYGALALSPFELIWLRDRIQPTLPPSLQKPDGTTFLDAHKWDLDALDERRQKIASYQAHLTRLKEAGGSIRPSECPWHWLPATEMSLEERETLLSLTRLSHPRQAQLDIFEQVTAKASAEALTAPLHWLEKHEAWEGQIPGSSRATVKRYFSISFTLRKPLCYRVSRSELPTIVDS